MNAVAAVLAPAGSPPARTTLGAMFDRMDRRAAGHRTVVAEHSVVIGAAGRGPAFSNKAGVAMLAGDIRLDNRAELCGALSLPVSSDDAVIALEAFAQWGDTFASRLAGAFALVIFDRARARLLAVRDPLGIRPLHYRAGVSRVRVASEIGALIEPGDRPDEGFLAEWLAGDIVDTEATPYLAVRRVPGGHLLIADAASARIVRYWTPPSEQLSGTLSEHAERFRAAFDEAVRAACAGRERVGVHLSGGLDSSSVLGSVMANGYADPVAGSLDLPWADAREREWIDAAARHWSIAPVIVTPPSPAGHDLGSIAATRDLPDFPNGAPLFAALHAALRDQSIDTVLTGLGGDQWWTGEAVYKADLLRRAKFADLRRWRGAGEGMGALAWSPGAFLRDAIAPLLPAAARRLARHVRPARLPGWIDPAFAARVGLLDRLRRRPETTGAPSESWRRLRWRIDSGEDAIVKERVDRMAVTAGLDLRHPMYDRRLVELALMTPDSARTADGRSRAVLREAMRDCLAPEIASRTTKADLTAVLVDAAQAPDLAPFLPLSHLLELGWVRPGEAEAIVTRVRDSRDVDAAYPFWSMVGLEAWLARMFGAK